MEKDSIRTCEANSHHHWVKKSLSHKLLRNSLENYHCTILFPQHLLLVPVTDKIPEQPGPLHWPSAILTLDLLFQMRQYETLLILKKQLALVTSHLQDNSCPSLNSLKDKSSLVYLSSCSCKKKKGKKEERDNLQDYKIQCGQTTPHSLPYNWFFITKQINEKVANFTLLRNVKFPIL